MKRKYKIFTTIVIFILLVPVAWDIFGAILDNNFDKFYISCVKQMGIPTEWSSECYQEYQKRHPTISSISRFMTEPGFGIFAPEFGIRFMLNGGCIKTGSKIKDGFIAKGRDYFKCNKVQVFISDVIYGPDGERF